MKRGFAPYFYRPMPPRVPKKKRAGKSNGSVRRILIAGGILVIVALLASFAWFYGRVFRPNLTLTGEQTGYVYIRTTDTFQDVLEQLRLRQMVRNIESFVWMAEFMDYPGQVRPGRYKVSNGMNNRELVSLLRSGRQDPLRITMQNFRTKEQLAGKIGALLEADSLSLINLLNDKVRMKSYGLTPASALGLFLPDTYEFYWNTTSEAFVEKMCKEYEKYWTEERRKKAVALGLSPAEVATVASIVMQESNKKDEWPVIAGVYLNRLKKGMKLQADPTVKFALGDFGLRRVRHVHLQIDSPYNTYKYAGLPPGPIYLASKSAIDSVLNARQHSYLYFCASPDMSGYHRFAVNYEQHQQNAREYQRALNKRGL